MLRRVIGVAGGASPRQHARDQGQRRSMNTQDPAAGRGA
jgi:hypothetical protein